MAKSPVKTTDIDDLSGSLSASGDFHAKANGFESLRDRLKRKSSFREDDLADLQNFLIKLSDKWFNIGVQLKVDSHKLSNIRQTYLNNEDALREMLIVCLRKRFTWNMLSTALKSQAVDGRRLLNGETQLSQASSQVAFNEAVNNKPRPLAVSSGQSSGASLLTSPERDTPPNPETESSATPSPIPQSPTINSALGYEKLPLYANKEGVDHTFKVVIVGDSGVGKTSLLERFAKAVPYENPQTTLSQRGDYIRVIKLQDSRRVKFEIWDTAGVEKNFHTIPNSFFRNADVALVAFDISNKQSFEHVKTDTSEKHDDFTTWVKETKLRLEDARHTVIILVGNKNDVKRRKVEYREAAKFAASNNLDYIETSSKEDNNVDQLFFLACQRLVESGSASVPNQSRSRFGSDNDKIHLERTRTESACCGRRRRPEA